MKKMKIINKTQELAKFCYELNKQEFITIDLEFLREKTYYAQLCLIQVATLDNAAIIDPLASNLDMKAFFEVLQNPAVVKVFHSGRQDIEILYNLSGFIPSPLFDTQIAAMVCGFGESVSYETLVNKIVNISLDKTCRLSNWSKRPLNENQLEYALSDVTHLVHIYQYLKNYLEKNHRLHWLDEEIEILKNPETYVVHSQDAWQKIKHRSHNSYFLTLLRELAAWREDRAKKKDIPRQNVIKDDCLLNLAALCPQNYEELEEIRNIRKDILVGKLANEILEVIAKAKNIPISEYVKLEKEKNISISATSLYELLKLLLKIKSQEKGVVAKLIACDDDLKNFSIFNDHHSPILKGWRREIFGIDALALREGRLSMGYDPEKKEIDIKTTTKS